MLSVGLRELKNRLADYIRRVRSGESVLVTDRGTVVAELRPPGTGAESTHHPGLARLARSGQLTIGGENDPSLYVALPPLAADGSAGDLIAEERRERER